MQAYRRHESTIEVLNAIILSLLAYAAAELLGLPTFANFYWQDFLPLSMSPAILSVIFGIVAAVMIKRRRRRSDFFETLGPELSEKVKTGYDNRIVRSLPMQSLASELEASLSRIKPSQVQDRRQINKRAFAAMIMLAIVILIAQSQISADITPADFQSLNDLREKVFKSQESEKPDRGSSTNLTGNLYGKPSLAVLNENKLQLLLYPGMGAGSLARSTQPVERIFQPSQAGEASAVPSELYIESLPPENKEIIKNYFEILDTGNF